MNAREYLEQLQIMEVRIEQNKELLKDMKLQAASIGAIRYDRDKVQTSFVDSKIETNVCKYVDFERTLNEQIKHFTDAKNKIIEQIQNLNNTNYMQLLFKVYVQYKTLKIVANEMKLSYSYILEVHKKSLKQFEGTYNNLLKPII